MDTRRGRCLLDLQPGACWAHPHFQGMQHMQHMQHVQHSSCPNSPLYALVMLGFDPDLMSHYLSAVCWDKKSDWYTTRFFFDLGWFKTLASSASIQQVWSKQFVVQTVQTVCTPGTVLKHDQTKLRHSDHSGFGSGGPLEPKRQTDRLLVELSILHGKNHVASLLTFDCSGASAKCCLDWRKLWSCKMNCWQIDSV